MVSKKHSSFFHGRSGKSDSFSVSIRHAIRGIALAFLLEANIRRQIIIFLLTIILALWINLELWQLVIVILAGVVVLAFELVNSALEALADAVHPDYSEYIQRAKDMMAAAVLFISLAALALGVAIFVPALLTKFASCVDVQNCTAQATIGVQLP